MLRAINLLALFVLFISQSFATNFDLWDDETQTYLNGFNAHKKGLRTFKGPKTIYKIRISSSSFNGAFEDFRKQVNENYLSYIFKAEQSKLTYNDRTSPIIMESPEKYDTLEEKEKQILSQGLQEIENNTWSDLSKPSIYRLTSEIYRVEFTGLKARLHLYGKLKKEYKKDNY